jgi:cysteinyl-tRNA synthetase
MIVKLFNTLSHQLEEFKPLDPDKVSIYVCGQTVYDRPHIGNIRSVVVYDILYRVLLEKYGKDKVLYIRNITDVDDKINAAAKKGNISIKELTAKMIKYFNEDVRALNCLKPNMEPKATEHISDMIQMISTLITNKNAYLSNGHVYFDVSSFKDYGKLSRRNIDELIAGSRVEISQDKKTPEDFVLWKPADKEDDVSSIFDSLWGKGRPGWHIECSAMSTKYLGKNFDIHGGGVDLIFPHHTNEIAQSRSCYKDSSYAQYWVHNGFLTVEGKKMSKSLGNFFTVRELLNQGIEGEVIRYIYLSTHYRKPLNWTQKSLENAKKALDNFYRVIQNHQFKLADITLDKRISEALYNDLNTPEALGLMHDMVKAYNKATTDDAKKTIAANLYRAGILLGLFYTTPKKWLKIGDDSDVTELIQQRSEAKKNKDWQKADEIRDKLHSMSIALEDHPDGTTTWHKN